MGCARAAAIADDANNSMAAAAKASGCCASKQRSLWVEDGVVKSAADASAQAAANELRF